MEKQTVIVYGGAGQLGRAVVSLFKSKGYNIISIDRVPNDQADSNISVLQDTLTQQASAVMDGLAECGPVPAVINVAGGWCGGNAKADDFVANVDLALRQSVWTSAIAAHVAAKKLAPGGLLILPGAAPVCDGGTAGMIAYGASKAAVHHMNLSVSSQDGGLPDGATSLCLAPVILDTPMNRKFMANADFSTWTPLSWVADQFLKWTENVENRPKNGSVCKLVTKNNETELITL